MNHDSAGRLPANDKSLATTWAVLRLAIPQCIGLLYSIQINYLFLKGNHKQMNIIPVYIRSMYRAVWPWSRVYKQTSRFDSTTGCHRQWNMSLPERGVSKASLHHRTVGLTFDTPRSGRLIFHLSLIHISSVSTSKSTLQKLTTIYAVQVYIQSLISEFILLLFCSHSDM